MQADCKWLQVDCKWMQKIAEYCICNKIRQKFSRMLILRIIAFAFESRPCESPTWSMTIWPFKEITTPKWQTLKQPSVISSHSTSLQNQLLNIWQYPQCTYLIPKHRKISSAQTDRIRQPTTYSYFFSLFFFPIDTYLNLFTFYYTQ